MPAAETSGAVLPATAASSVPAAEVWRDHLDAGRAPVLAQRVGAVLTGALQQRLLRAWRIWARTEVMVITPRNRHRIAINRKFTEEHIKAVNRAMPPTATWRQRGVLLIDGVFHRYRPYDRNPPRYDEHWQKTWRRIATEETMGNKYAPVLSVIIGRRYMLTQNVNLSHGVANGMWAVVRDVRLREGAVPRWDKEAGAHRIDATDVEGLVVRYPDRDWGSQKLHTDLPLGHFLIALDDPANAPPGSKRFDIELGGDVKKFRISQFPLIQAGPRDAPSLVPPLFMRRGHVCPLSPLRPSAGARGQRPQGAGPDTAPDRDRTPLFQGRHRRLVLPAEGPRVVLHSRVTDEAAHGPVAGPAAAPAHERAAAAAGPHATTAAGRAGGDGAAGGPARADRRASRTDDGRGRRSSDRPSAKRVEGGGAEVPQAVTADGGVVSTSRARAQLAGYRF